ncbi:uncharacterized protein KY384_004031 [Bacidia gigantensis]|uniref:uncharacterized protein n=1 Tax=Bacidia gigantensis TaxID=2732470 RepID=UPI001D0398A4|nr:uncharacterized protein KY384_004031 [Bacidia gigantensis]KAG8530676.1 hypothetical protein KY384_004031 [Bacidia gigantensis]
MQFPPQLPEHRKRKRRRRPNREPLSAWLQPSENIKGNEALISRSLFSELFGHDAYQKDEGEHVQRHCIAVTPWSPQPSRQLQNHHWTILPIRVGLSKEEEPSEAIQSVIRCPPAFAGLDSLLRQLQSNPYDAHGNGDRLGHRLNVLEVEPLSLSSIYISVDGDALRKHEEVQNTFGGGFLSDVTKGHVGTGKKLAKVGTKSRQDGVDHSVVKDAIEEDLIVAVRQALDDIIIARQGDDLRLPLPTHPITHVPFPPAQIVLCEPVSQGIPTPLTKIVLNRTPLASKPEPSSSQGPLPVLSSSKSLTDFDITDADGNSSEDFHSATEDGDNSDDENQKSDPEPDEADVDSADSSDDSSDDMITMNTPSLAIRPSMMSSRTTVTPRGYASRTNGVSTPGSIFSNMTSMTARQNQLSRGKVFKVQGLSQRVPHELLHPTPSIDNDEECRVFVDIKLLVRLGCFSGDWVKLEPIRNEDQMTKHLMSISSLQVTEDYKPAKIFGLTDLYSPAIRRSEDGMPRTRRSSVQTSTGFTSGALTAWVPPILFTNLQHPQSIRISPLFIATPHRPSSRPKSSNRKLDSTAAPPTANEMSLLKISTPLSTDPSPSLQNALFVALKQYFELQCRIVHQGDLIAVPLDAFVSRLFARPGQASDTGLEMEELLGGHEAAKALKSASDIAWFKVGPLSGPEPLEASDMASNVWNGAFCIVPNSTRTSTAGSEQCKLPSSLAQSYWGILQSPRTTLASLSTTYSSNVQRRLRELFAAATNPRALHMKMAPIIILLHSNQRNIGKSTLAKRAASDIGLHTFSIDAYDLLAEGTGGGDVKAETSFQLRCERALACGAAYTTILLRHVEALTADRMTKAIKDVIKDARVFIATSTELDKLPQELRGLFSHEIEVSAPDEGEREGLLQNILQERGLRLASDVDLAAIAVKTAALVAGNLADVADRAQAARQDRLEKLVTESSQGNDLPLIRDAIVAGGDAGFLTKADFEVAVEAARKNFADAIGAPKIPNVTWDDVGGLEQVKDAVLETIQLPLERPELFSKGMKKRSGILFYGPPGTGKTLLAKAIATEFSLNFFSIKGPELLNMYIGESEANVRRVFQRARDARPCVVFFDELDSVAPKRGNQGDSGGVMDRIVSQLLAELDGMSDGEENGSGVFVIGATNRPDLLDQALLRPGRFDKMLYLGVSDTHDRQLTILEALTRKFAMHPEMSLRRVSESLPFTYTGADLYALCSDAMLKAITRQASAVDAKIKALPGGPVTTAYFFDHLATKEDISVMVTEDDFANAQNELVPSVSVKELEHYQRVRQNFEGPSKPRSMAVVSTAAPNAVDGNLRPPSPTKRKAPKRTNTAINMNGSASVSKGKGKGKATKWDSDDDDDDAYVTSNDYSTPERRRSNTNNTNGFGNGADDDDLYE